MSTQPELHERLYSDGVRGLNDHELITVLLPRSEDPWLLARTVLDKSSNCLVSLAQCSPLELKNLPGLCARGAARLAVAMELGRRRMGLCALARTMVNSSTVSHALLKPVLMDLQHEEFWVLFLDHAMGLIARERLSMGGGHGTAVDPKQVFRMALDRHASCIVVAHNHPSGQLFPSKEDMAVTNKLLKGGKLLDVKLHDHLIISSDGYFSFADAKLIR